MSSAHTPPMRQVQRQPTIDGLYTIDPQDLSGLEHVPATPYMYKSLRPQTNEGLQAGIPTKHLAGLQISTSDHAPEYVEDESYGRPVYFERDGFKKWQSPAPATIFGIRRRIFWLVVAVILLVLAAASIGIGVGVSTAQSRKNKDALAAASTSSASATSTSLSTASASNGTTTTSKPTSTTILSTIGETPTQSWSITTQLVPEFTGLLSLSATPSFYTTAAVTVQAHVNDTAISDGSAAFVLNDCPAADNNTISTSLNMPFRKMCYQTIEGAKLAHAATTSSLDDCIEECALQNQNVNITGQTTCWSVTYSANRTHANAGDTEIPDNCLLWRVQGTPGPGDWMTASAVLLDNGIDPGK